MFTRTPHSVALPVLAMCVLAAMGPAIAQETPNQWLDRMSSAVQTLNYEGTVVRVSGGVAEALKVVHVVADGVIQEKVIAQEGDGLEIIRIGNEVHCILPGQRSVLVEEWNDQSTLFSTLPSSHVRFGNEYDVSLERKDRVAGRNAVEIAIRPHDEYRYGHRIWLDLETGFPLQTLLIGENGAALEQVKFADISLDREILASSLKPSHSTENFRWYSPPQRRVTPVVDVEWQSDDLPAGFRIVSAQNEVLPGSDEPVMHIMYSDGLANVSVFIDAHSGQSIAERSRVGASSTFSTIAGEHRVTAVGQVPEATVERIARSMQRR